MMNSIRSILIWMATCSFIGSSPTVANPFELSYGGRLTDAKNDPLSGPVDLELSFFRTSSGGASILGAPVVFTAVQLFDGVFQVNLQSLSSADKQQIFNGSDDVWIEVKDVTHAVALPRQRYGSVPFALKVPVDGQSILYNSDGQLTIGAISGAASPGANSDITALTGLTTAITVQQGGTNATTPAAARANLGAAASGANNDITSLVGLTTALSLSQGGTGAGNPANARSNLGAAASGVNTDITALSGLTTAIGVSQGGTGASSAQQARANIGAASSGTNNDITALTSLTTALSVNQGGTGATTPGAARSALGAAASGANWDISSLNGLISPLDVAKGGTGAINQSDARFNLGAAAAGANSDITELKGLTKAVLVSQGGTGATDAATARANLGIGSAATLAAGSSADALVQLDSQARLPAVDGSQLTQLNASNLASGSIPLARLPAATNGDILYYSNGWQKLPIGTAGQSLAVSDTNSPTWGSDSASAYNKRRMSAYKTAGSAAINSVGLPAAPTLTASTSSADDVDGPQLSHATSSVSGTASGVISAFTVFRRSWDPEYISTIKTDANNTSIRYWIGMFSANIDAVTVPTVQHVAAFRYDTGADGTAFWRTVTCDGVNAAVVTTTNVAVNADTRYVMRVACGANDCKFYINNVLVSTHTTSLPGSSQTLGYGNRVVTLTAASRTIRWGRIDILHK